MKELFRGRLAIKYIFLEMLPSFILGNLVFLFILLMFQALRLTEQVISVGVHYTVIFKIMSYLSIAFLPMILPMSLLFSVLLTYGRLSNDSEVVAFKSLGLNIWHLAFPAIVLSILAFGLSAQTAFYLAPWGNRQFEVLISEIGRTKASATLKEGVFSKAFFDLVIYANKVDPKAGTLDKVFIYDERDPKAPLTIIAKTGEIISKVTPAGILGSLRLNNGDIHRTDDTTYTKVHFDSYDIHLFNPTQSETRNKSFPSYNIDEIKAELRDPKLPHERRVRFQIEYHTKWALSLACILFGMLGVGLGTTTNKRSARGGGFVMSVAVVIAYWLLYVTFESFAKKEIVPVWIAIWTVNVIFLGLSIHFLRRARN